tara:strand:+ start:57890 stop:59617 length:1728 start_codon:yes stop_codon:yes gene_type:complete
MDEELLNTARPPVAPGHETGTPPSKKPLSAGVVLCATVILFVVAAVVGSAGHAAYEAIFTTIDRATFVASAALIGGIDEHADVCTEPWAFMCGMYDDSHYMSRSHIGDMGMAERKRAFVAFVASGGGAANVFYARCTQYAERPDASMCTHMYTGNYTLAEMWQRGMAPNSIGISRTPDPYSHGVRTVVLWDGTESPDIELYPELLTCDDDPCDLCDLFRSIMCSGWATPLECELPRFLVYGTVSGLCARWRELRANVSHYAEIAAAEAQDQCFVTMARAASDMGCFTKTAAYFPDTNTPYLQADKARAENEAAVAEWFGRARDMAVQIAAPFGPGVQAQLRGVVLHAGWEATNLPVPPAQLAVATADVSLAETFAAYDRWALDETMRTAVHTYPKWEMNSWSINAYYTPSENAIYVPNAMATLLSPIEAVTVGTLMFVIAHELGHAFDPASPAMHAGTGGPTDAYAKLKECLYSNYSSKGLTIGEDWADFIGMKVVTAYASRVGSRDIHVSDAKYTAAQQILMAFGGFWCAATDDDPDPNGLQDPHSLPKDRVARAVQSFARELRFDCPPARCSV